MDTTPTSVAPGEQPTPAQTTDPALVAGAQPLSNGGDFAHAIESLDPETLKAILEGSPPPAESQEPPEEVPPAAEVIQPLESEQQPVENHEANTPKSLQRLSVKGLPAEQQIMLADAIKAVRNGEAPDLITAIMGGKPAQAATGETGEAGNHDAEGEGENPPAPGVESAPSGVADLQSQIVALREQRQQAARDYDQPAVSELSEKIEDLMLELQEAKIAAKAVAAEVGNWQVRHDAAVEAVEAKYSAILEDQTSPFGKYLDAMVVAAKASNDPRLADPNFIVAFADEVAADLGIGHAPSQRVISPPPVRASRPAGSAVTPGHTQQTRYTADQIKQMIESAPVEALEALAFDR